ncbi:MAG: Gfo/Idh/MocA family oxidoreductase [Clostridia bacterium]|nr:Gfo/Idh/MocA family oxidoreductase [Clostridia bacterium]MBN2882051.1 Gfo/Idh/MocA family oxidoreductase [Clostridia bacterium]
MDRVRLGIIGYGSMGSSHADYIVKGEVPGCELTAVFDKDTGKVKKAHENLPEYVSVFNDLDSLLTSGIIDAVLIATPHYFHPEIAIQAFEKGFHVLCEKPAGVYTNQVEEMNTAAVKSGKVFSMMFNQRTNPIYQKTKEMVSSGELGELKRCVWIITDWYRPQSYFNAGTWRATWKGEGGGVLLNQDPHQLDLWQWICGMPVSISARCYFGKFHDIEVEDDVTAFVEYENGATGVFITSTGEAPGTNRFEISGDMGKIVIEGGKLTFYRLEMSERKFNKEFKGGFGQPEFTVEEINVEGENPSHKGITRNFVNAILHGEKLIAPGSEGIKSLTLSNAMLLSSWLDQKLSIPIDGNLYKEMLDLKIKESTHEKEISDVILDTKGTY